MDGEYHVYCIDGWDLEANEVNGGGWLVASYPTFDAAYEACLRVMRSPEARTPAVGSGLRRRANCYHPVVLDGDGSLLFAPTLPVTPFDLLAAN